MREKRGPWYLLTGLILGAILGLVYAWVIDPVEYVDMHPASLREDFKNQYRVVIAAAFAADADLARAQARLALLKDPDPARSLEFQAQQALADGRSEKEVQALSLLAVSIEDGSVSFAPAPAAQLVMPTVPVLRTPTEVILPTETPTALLASPTVLAEALTPAAGEQTPPAATPIPTRMSAGGTRTPGPTATRTPVPTPAPIQSRTPTPTQGAPYVLDSMEETCEPANVWPLLIVEAVDGSGNPVPGVEVIVVWTGGEDRFFTGFKPDLGVGYADFVLTPGVTYSLHLAGGGEPVSGISTEACQADNGQEALLSWRLVFVQP